MQNLIRKRDVGFQSAVLSIHGGAGESLLGRTADHLTRCVYCYEDRQHRKHLLGSIAKNFVLFQ